MSQQDKLANRQRRHDLAPFVALNAEPKKRSPAAVSERWALVDATWPGWRNRFSASGDWDTDRVVVDLIRAELADAKDRVSGPRLMPDPDDATHRALVMDALERWGFAA